jgi:hypothetical protein
VTAVAMSAANYVTRIAMAAAPLATVTPLAAAVPTPVESIVGEGRRQRRKNESNAKKTAERNSFGLDHGVLLPDVADKLRPIGHHASTFRNATQP